MCLLSLSSIQLMHISLPSQGTSNHRLSRWMMDKSLAEISAINKSMQKTFSNCVWIGFFCTELVAIMYRGPYSHKMQKLSQLLSRSLGRTSLWILFSVNGVVRIHHAKSIHTRVCLRRTKNFAIEERASNFAQSAKGWACRAQWKITNIYILPRCWWFLALKTLLCVAQFDIQRGAEILRSAHFSKVIFKEWEIIN